MSAPDLLALVRQAAAAKRRADSEYRAALVAAVDAGATYAQLARELGISRQSVRVLVERARARDDA